MSGRTSSRSRASSCETRLRLLAALRGGDVGLVARGVGQRPPRGRELVAHQAATRGERRRDASLRLLVRHPYRDMDRATAVRARLVHLLEPEPHPSAARVHKVLGGAAPAVAARDRVGLELPGPGQRADRLRGGGACREGPGSKVRVRAVADYAPILDALGLAELLRADLVGHEVLLCLLPTPRIVALT